MTGARRTPWAVVFRSLAIQGSWNYETLTGTGFAFVILPALRRIYPDPAALEAAVHRHEGMFNSHPYLAPLALGAVIRMEQDGEDPAVIERFKAALRSSLGTLGDQLVWAGWRPVSVLCALALLLAGVPWWATISAFLLGYNALHVTLMVWGLRLGLAEGRHVAERLRASLVRTTQPRLMTAGAFAAGLVLALVVIRGVPDLDPGLGHTWVPAAVGAAVAGAAWGNRARRAGVAGVVALAVIGVALGVVA